MKPSSIRSFLSNPAVFAKTIDPLSKELWLKALPIASQRNKYPFLPAQKKAWKDISERRLALLLGPPGTGKTYMIAWMITSYMVACMEYNKKNPENPITCRVLVSAFTRVAIENVLKEIVERLDVFPELKDIVIAFQEESERLPKKVYQEGKENLFQFHLNNFVIIGATSWTFLKSMEKTWVQNENFHAEIFDLICFDEASQMRLRESLLSMALLKENARILFVGDNKQLPPVGEVFEWAEKENSLGSSAYDFIHHSFTSLQEDQIVLEDTFRLNPMLADLPSRTLYNKKYKSQVSPSNYALPLQDTWKQETETWKHLVLNPDNSIAVILLDAPAAGKINLAEVDIIEELTVLFRKYMIPDPEKQDAVGILESFWENQLGIISPHRLQNIEIKKRIEKRDVADGLSEVTAWSDTVEKMQGQSRDCVLISMTVSDREFAMQEGGFLFDMRRFNVAITRSKHKVVLIMSPILLNSLSNDEEVAKGVTFLMNFLFQCTERWNGNINGFPARVYTQRISEFIEKEQRETNSELVRDIFDVWMDDITNDWMPLSAKKNRISNQQIYDCFLKGYIDVRIHQNAKEIRRRKIDTLPLPISMLETQYKTILNSDMEYFDFANHFQWFSNDGKDKISNYIERLQQKNLISILWDGQQKRIQPIVP